jgi:hypothetical protein
MRAKPPIPNKSDAIVVRAEPARKWLYIEAAAKEGLRLSDWIRRLADRRLSEALKESDR